MPAEEQDGGRNYVMIFNYRAFLKSTSINLCTGEAKAQKYLTQVLQTVCATYGATSNKVSKYCTALSSPSVKAN